MRASPFVDVGVLYKKLAVRKMVASFRIIVQKKIIKNHRQQVQKM